MQPVYLLPESKVREAGVTPELDLGESHETQILLTLGITHILEQESLDLSIWASPDTVNWGAQPLVAFTQKFYCGRYQTAANVPPDSRYLRADWRVSRWSRRKEKPLFEFYVLVEGGKPKAMASGA